MKAKKKPHGIKQKIREQKEREKRILLRGITVAILITIISISGFIANSILNNSVTSTSELKAAIVDHLSLTFPNQTFIQAATSMLNQSGYRVDYYPGEKVTVDFYRNLPTHDYSIIILRVHSTHFSLFTSEPYDGAKYINEQLTERLTGVMFLQDSDGVIYFGIAPSFVKSSMKGRFQNSIIVMMGCNGLTYTDMAEAFSEKGAKVYIGWSLSVLGDHTDRATIRLLQHLLLDKQTIDQAVKNTTQEVGADPANESVLDYYPSIVGDQTTEDIFATKQEP